MEFKREYRYANITPCLLQNADEVCGGEERAYVHMAFYQETCGMIRSEECRGLLDFKTSKWGNIPYFNNKTTGVLDIGGHFCNFEEERGLPKQI